MIPRALPPVCLAALLSGCIALEVPAGRLGCDADLVGAWRSGALSRVIGGSENATVTVDADCRVALPNGRDAVHATLRTLRVGDARYFALTAADAARLLDDPRTVERLGATRMLLHPYALRDGALVVEELDAQGLTDALAAGTLAGARRGPWTVALDADGDIDTVLASLPPMPARDAIVLQRAAPTTTSTPGAQP